MATYVQRWSALCEALLGAPATVAQMTRLGEAIGALTPPGLGGPVYSDMTNAQKAEYCIKYARHHFLDLVRNKDYTAIMASTATLDAAVASEFPEVTP